jgi:hypothetical protein
VAIISFPDMNDILKNHMAKKKSKPKVRLIVTIFLVVTLLIFDGFLFKYRNYRKQWYKIENKEKVVQKQPGQIIPQKKIEPPIQETPKKQAVEIIPEKPVYASAAVTTKPAISIKPKANAISENPVKEIKNEKALETIKNPVESGKPSYTITHKDVRSKAVSPIAYSSSVSYRVIKGTVVNAETGASLSRVRVNAGISTDEILTDMSGNFEISVDTTIKKIYFLCSGFEDKIIDVNSINNTIALKKLISTKIDDLLPKKTVGSPDYTISVSDSDQGYRLYKAIEMARNGDTANALNELNELTILNKRNIAAWNEIIKISLNSQDKKAALKGLKRLSAIVSTEKLKSNISKISKLAEQGRYDDALSELKKLKLERQY